MSMRENLKQNLHRLMLHRGYNMQALHDLSVKKGVPIHKTTISNLLHTNKPIKSETIDSLSITLGIPASILVWENGLDEAAVPIGYEASPSISDIEWVYRRIDMVLEESGVNDIYQKASIFSACLKTASTEGREAADDRFLTLLRDYCS